jgi:hypothetical membrane protein
MWTLLLFAGIILTGVGAYKRKTNWGTPTALLGLVSIGVSLVVAGPDMYDAFMRGFNEAYNPDVPRE